jgi:hypothetical protein
MAKWHETCLQTWKPTVKPFLVILIIAPTLQSELQFLKAGRAGHGGRYSYTVTEATALVQLRGTEFTARELVLEVQRRKIKKKGSTASFFGSCLRKEHRRQQITLAFRFAGTILAELIVNEWRPHKS